MIYNIYIYLQVGRWVQTCIEKEEKKMKKRRAEGKLKKN